MIIAVSMRVTESPDQTELRDAISHDWMRLLAGLNVTPVPVPNVLPDPPAYLRAIDARGLILTGGEDIGPMAGEAGADQAPLTRDRTERDLLAAAINQRFPVFGVCRGMQLINVGFGGTLARDLQREVAHSASHVATRHEVELREPRWLALAGGAALLTNSFHRQGVTLPRLAKSLRASAVAHGEIVEGLRHPELPVVGVQWHPERENPSAAFDRALILEWLAQCA